MSNLCHQLGAAGATLRSHLPPAFGHSHDGSGLCRKWFAWMLVRNRWPSASPVTTVARVPRTSFRSRGASCDKLFVLTPYWLPAYKSAPRAASTSLTVDTSHTISRRSAGRRMLQRFSSTAIMDRGILLGRDKAVVAQRMGRGPWTGKQI